MMVIMIFDLENYYYYIYEIFENKEKQQFLIVSAFPHSMNPGSYSDFSNIKRGLSYIICLDNDLSHYYVNFNNMPITTRKAFDYYGSGNIIESINQEAKTLTLLSGDKGNEKKLKLSMFDYSN